MHLEKIAVREQSRIIFTAEIRLRIELSLCDRESVGYMELARVSVFIKAVIIKDPVSGIAALLHLGEKHSAADGVKSTRLDKEEIARMHLHSADIIGESAVPDSLFKSFCGYFLFETE